MNDLVPSSMNALVDGNGEYNDELAKFLGQNNQDGPQLLLPELKVNKDFEDDEEQGVKLTPGTFMLGLDGKEYYSKKAYFRPFMQTFQITEYDPNEKKFKGKTIQVKKWSEEMVDTRGGIRMGKMKAKDKKQLDADDPKVKAEKNKNMYRIIYGTVRMPDAVGRNGKKNPLTEPTPVLFKRTGTNFMPFDEEYIQQIDKLKKLMPQFELEVTLERKKNGDVTYYIAHYSFDQNKPIQLDANDIELMKKFQETIDFDNEDVWKQYNKATGAKQAVDQDKNFLENFESKDGDLDNDFKNIPDNNNDSLDDEIPF